MTENLAEKLLKYPTAIGRVFIVIINNVYCIPTYVIWMGLLIPLKRINPDYYYKIEGIFFHWLLAIVSMWSYSAGYDIVEVGDDIEECLNKRTLVMANHQSTADVPLLMANFNAKENILPNIMWIMDRLFKYTNFGIVSIIHQDFFIASGRNKREESITALRSHMKNSFLKRKRNWMVLFPEGGFLRKRREVSHRFAKKNDLPLLDYVTLPRVGALKAIVDVLCDKEIDENINKKSNFNKNHCVNNITITGTGTDDNCAGSSNINSNCSSSSSTGCTGGINSIQDNTIPNKQTDNIIGNGDSKDIQFTNKQIQSNYPNIQICTDLNSCQLEYVLDITIAYPNGIPLDLPNILHGLRGPCQTNMLYRLYKVQDIPTKDSDALTNWLYQIFVEKNELLANFYKTGEFYLDHTRYNMGTVIQQDFLRFVLINIFFITSTYFHYQLFTKLYSYCYYLTYGIS